MRETELMHTEIIKNSGNKKFMHWPSKLFSREEKTSWKGPGRKKIPSWKI